MLIGCPFQLLAQKNQGKVNRILLISSDSFLLDSSFILKGSVHIENYQEGKDFRINYFHHAFINIKMPVQQLVEIQYTVSNYDFSKPVFKRDISLIQPELRADRNPFAVQGIEPEYKLFTGTEGLQSTGSIMRGLSIGNNSNSIVNSNLNLQLAGKINNDVEILAAISDENNPIQPEGNTQDLQDFDQVYVQFSKNKNKLIVGDFLMNRPQNSYFMNYYKKSRGLHASSELKLKNGMLLQNQIEAALSRGRFVRNTFNGTEGNQGPYRLSGANGELFIIIISGTESVYLDGEKLNRGEQNDYVIDYNSGEITFMPKRLISSFSRIVVEFQYSDRNYARTVLTAAHANKVKNSTYYLQFYSEQDNKNQPFQQSLTDSNKLVLAEVGNETEQAVISGATLQTAFQSGKILYRLVDTLNAYRVYVYSPVPSSDSNYYECKFSYVGAGNGNYIQSASAANGRVFKWVEPINGIAQGDFEPVIKLIAPNKRQMLGFGYIYDNNKNKYLQLEWAASNDDKNTFSDKGNSDNLGMAFRLNGKRSSNNQSSQLQITQSVFYEFTSLRFKPVERYRTVEFDRTWQRQINNQAQNSNAFAEHIAQYQFDLSRKNTDKLSYKFAYYNKGFSLLSGFQNQFALQFKWLGFTVNSDLEWLTAKQQGLLGFQAFQNEVKNQNYQIARSIRAIRAGIKFKTESSLFKGAADTLLANSFQYINAGAFLENTDSLQFKWNVKADRRVDALPFGKSMADFSVADEFKGSLSYNAKNFNRWRFDLSYRNFSVLKNSSLIQPEETFLGRIEYDYGFLNRKITANTYLQTGSGSELRRDFQYLEVPIGQGVYVWKDFNSDGVQQLNEFVPAAMADKYLANYIKVFLPSSSLIGTFSNQFNQTLQLSTFNFSRNKSSWNSFLNKWSNQTGFRYEQKKLNNGNDLLSRIWPVSVNDTGLISMNSSLRNTLFFNRSNAVFGADYTYQTNQGKILQTNGAESRSKTEHSFNFRWNFSAAWSIQNTYNTGNKKYYSAFFTDNSYNFYYQEIKPKLQYQYKQYFRMGINYSYFEAVNQYELNNEQARVQELGTELRFSLSKLGAIQVKYSFYQIDFTGNASGNLAYEMLQGLSNGNNQLWNINLQQRLGSNLQINFNYDGRISGNLNTIHIGRMEARYLF
ncbi:MAG: hypothetical protein ACOVP1_08565 [Bacteroidia bacterium]